MEQKGDRGRISVSFTGGEENMEQPSLLVQLSSSLHQLNMALVYTGEGERQKKRGGKDMTGERGFRKRRRGRKGERRRRRRAGRLLAAGCNPE